MHILTFIFAAICGLSVLSMTFLWGDDTADLVFWHIIKMAVFFGSLAALLITLAVWGVMFYFLGGGPW